jgi:hypothetical protein
MNRFVLVEKTPKIPPMFVAIIRGVVERGDKKKILSNASDSLMEELLEKEIFLSETNVNNKILIKYILKKLTV